MMRRAVCIGLLILSIAARGESGGYDDLMQLLAARRHGHVDFVEQHFLALLKRPTESSGELIYDAPDRLEKRTLQPRTESLVLNGDLLTIRRGRHSRQLDLKAYPEIEPFVESIRATLAGDPSGLEKIFKVEFFGAVARWALVLVPRDSEMAKTVSQIRIDGSRDSLSTVEIREADGDRSLMTLRDRPEP
jgi:Outer membrane lipoprotein carrier protein LolA-like